jgi:hypothetical protein
VISVFIFFTTLPFLRNSVVKTPIINKYEKEKDQENNWQRTQYIQQVAIKITDALTLMLPPIPSLEWNHHQ